MGTPTKRYRVVEDSGSVLALTPSAEVAEASLGAPGGWVRTVVCDDEQTLELAPDHAPDVDVIRCRVEIISASS